MSGKRKGSSRGRQEEHDPPHLAPGSQVEISSNEPGFRGSWFIGTVLKRASPAAKFLVQYSTLSQDDAGTKPLKETIHAADLRPLAPREAARSFKFGEEVDAYHNDGWWEGIITRELGNGRFHVYFKRSKEQLEFGEHQLRLHREWINGSWKPPLDEQQEEKSTHVDSISEKQVTQGKLESEIGENKFDSDEAVQGHKSESGNTTGEKFSEGARVEVRSTEEGFLGAWFAGTIVKATEENDKYLVQYDSLRTEDDTDFLKEEFDILDIRPSPPEIVVADRFKRLDEVDALYNDGWWVGVISKVLSDSSYVVYFTDGKEELTFKHSELRLHQDWIDGKWFSPFKVLRS